MAEPVRDASLENRDAASESRERRPTPETAVDLGAERERRTEDTGEQQAEAGAEVQELGAAAERKKRRAEAVRPPDEVGVKVERALEDNLWDVYLGLAEGQREQFRANGEATARAIRTLLANQKIRANRIHKLVEEWLKKIPGVNWAFLIQEGKIKTDTLVKLAEWIRARTI